MHIGDLINRPATVELFAKIMNATGREGDTMRKDVHGYAQTHDGHNKSFGFGMGHRYESFILFESEVDAKREPLARTGILTANVISQVSRSTVPDIPSNFSRRRVSA
jgi:hypothetical protein